MSKADESAFPHGFYNELGQSGLTKRELLAARRGEARQGKARQGKARDFYETSAKAKMAVRLADALLIALGKEKK